MSAAYEVTEKKFRYIKHYPTKRGLERNTFEIFDAGAGYHIWVSESLETRQRDKTVSFALTHEAAIALRDYLNGTLSDDITS